MMDRHVLLHVVHNGALDLLQPLVESGLLGGFAHALLRCKRVLGARKKYLKDDHHRRQQGWVGQSAQNTA